jgi:hypothetical protein
MKQFVVTLQSVDTPPEAGSPAVMMVVFSAEDEVDAVFRAVIAARCECVYRVVNVVPVESQQPSQSAA